MRSSREKYIWFQQSSRVSYSNNFFPFRLTTFLKKASPHMYMENSAKFEQEHAFELSIIPFPTHLTQLFIARFQNFAPNQKSNHEFSSRPSNPPWPELLVGHPSSKSISKNLMCTEWKWYPVLAGLDPDALTNGSNWYASYSVGLTSRHLFGIHLIT